MSGWIGVDLDGTLSEHYWPQKGPYDHTRIGDPIPLMVERVKRWITNEREVRIFTARVSPTIRRCSCHNDPDHVQQAYGAIAEWTLMHIGTVLGATATKDYQMIELWDDRCVRVIMNTGLRCCYYGRPDG